MINITFIIICIIILIFKLFEFLFNNFSKNNKISKNNNFSKNNKINLYNQNNKNEIKGGLTIENPKKCLLLKKIVLDLLSLNKIEFDLKSEKIINDEEKNFLDKYEINSFPVKFTYIDLNYNTINNYDNNKFNQLFKKYIISDENKINLNEKELEQLEVDILDQQSELELIYYDITEYCICNVIKKENYASNLILEDLSPNEKKEINDELNTIYVDNLIVKLCSKFFNIIYIKNFDNIKNLLNLYRLKDELKNQKYIKNILNLFDCFRFYNFIISSFSSFNSFKVTNFKGLDKDLNLSNLEVLYDYMLTINKFYQDENISLDFNYFEDRNKDTFDDENCLFVFNYYDKIINQTKRIMLGNIEEKNINDDVTNLINEVEQKRNCTSINYDSKLQLVTFLFKRIMTYTSKLIIDLIEIDNEYLKTNSNLYNIFEKTINNSLINNTDNLIIEDKKIDIFTIIDVLKFYFNNFNYNEKTILEMIIPNVKDKIYMNSYEFIYMSMQQFSFDKNFYKTILDLVVEENKNKIDIKNRYQILSLNSEEQILLYLNSEEQKLVSFRIENLLAMNLVFYDTPGHATIIIIQKIINKDKKMINLFFFNPHEKYELEEKTTDSYSIYFQEFVDIFKSSNNIEGWIINSINSKLVSYQNLQKLFELSVIDSPGMCLITSYLFAYLIITISLNIDIDISNISLINKYIYNYFNNQLFSEKFKIINNGNDNECKIILEEKLEEKLDDDENINYYAKLRDSSYDNKLLFLSGINRYKLESKFNKTNNNTLNFILNFGFLIIKKYLNNNIDFDFIYPSYKSKITVQDKIYNYIIKKIDDIDEKISQRDKFRENLNLSLIELEKLYHNETYGINTYTNNFNIISEKINSLNYLFNFLNSPLNLHQYLPEIKLNNDKISIMDNWKNWEKIQIQTWLVFIVFRDYFYNFNKKDKKFIKYGYIIKNNNLYKFIYKFCNYFNDNIKLNNFWCLNGGFKNNKMYELLDDKQKKIFKYHLKLLYGK